VIVIKIILKSFQIIICYKSNPILELFHIVYLAPINFFCLFVSFFFTPFQCFFSFVYLYLIVNLFNESNFRWHFAYQIKNENKH
jgi:hypothetical protein